MDDSLAAIAAEFSEDFVEDTPNNGNYPTFIHIQLMYRYILTFLVPSSSKSEINPVKQIKQHTLLVNPKQRGNPLLKSIINVPWEYDDIVPDYQMGVSTCALFLSLRYHNLNPDYIHDRIKLLGQMYQLRVLLVQVDISDPHHILKNLTRICILADLTLILAWSAEEAGKIIESYKIYENKPADRIMEKSETSPHLKVSEKKNFVCIVYFILMIITADTSFNIN